MGRNYIHKKKGTLDNMLFFNIKNVPEDGDGTGLVNTVHAPKTVRTENLAWERRARANNRNVDNARINELGAKFRQAFNNPACEQRHLSPGTKARVYQDCCYTPENRGK